MANPNIVNVQGINGNTAFVIPNSSSATVLLANAANSANVYKIGLVSVTNQASTAQTASVSIYTNGSQAANSSPAGGVTYPIINQISIPANASLVVTDKTAPFYLSENQSIVVTSAYANQLCFVTSYEQIF